MKKRHIEIKNQFDLHLANLEKSDLIDIVFQLVDATGFKLMRVEHRLDDGTSFDTVEVKKKSVIYPELRTPKG